MTKIIQLKDRAQEIRFLPLLKVSYAKNQIEFTGYCLPMDSDSVFKKVNQVVDQVLSKGKLRFVFRLTHFNTPSSKQIHLLLKRLQKLYVNGNTNIEVVWSYNADDYEMFETGEEFSELVPKLNFSVEEF